MAKPSNATLNEIERRLTEVELSVHRLARVVESNFQPMTAYQRKALNRMLAARARDARARKRGSG